MSKKNVVVKEQEKGLVEVQKGPVVATIWPETVEYSEDAKSAGELAEKYSHLKQLDPDDKPSYKELVAAIADVRTKRTDVAKEEKVIKDPLNKFRDVVIKTSKTIRGLLGATEDALKDEKKRIDDINAERKAAMQKLWQTNLNSITSLTVDLAAMGDNNLISLLGDLNEYDFEALDFGEYIDQAKTAVATAVNVVSERVDFLKEQKRLADERLWNDNLNIVRNWASNVSQETDEGLQETICRLEAFELATMEFGDLFEQAKTSLLDAHNRALLEDNRRGAARAEKKRQDDAALKLVQENNQRIARENEEKKKRDDEKAEADRKQAESDAELQKLRDQIAAMQKKDEPEEVVFCDNGDDIEERIQTADYGHSDSSVAIETDNGEIVNITPVAGRAAAIKQEPESTVDSEAIAQEAANIAAKNDNAIGEYIDSLKALSNETPAFEDNDVYQRSVDKVNSQLLQMISFLENKTTVVG